MKPSVGRIVRFVEDGIESAAIITRVWTDVCVNLSIFEDGHGLNQRSSVVYAEPPAAQGASWHWPPRD